MISFYIVLVGMLLLLAVFDLFVGVSNDAVNFLNSAVGSKSFKFRTLLIFASVGVFCGATFSNGMMDIARHGIFVPQYYTFAELMGVFVAVILTDVVLLDIFNSLGMPTSTTVSMVFELLGASVAVSIIKVVGNDSLDIGSLINTSKALSVILAIFVSVAVAFTVGTIVQYVTRLVFTFGYKRNLRYFIGVFGSVSFTSIFYFILVKGFKNMAFVNEGFRAFVSENEGLILVGMLAGFFVVSQVLHAFKVNVLKAIIGFGTFSLALAFAGNDLVNFVGVPLTGLSSMQHLLADGGQPDTYVMTALMKSEPGQWYLLMIAGIVMVVALVTSKKARVVLKTSVSLSAQNSTDEIFGTNPVARALVRGFRNVFNFVSMNIPQPVLKKVKSRFDSKELTLEPDASFDMLRASVNLMLASSLIALGTSLKLPLSTTYVTFMVAMGSSLADRAWSRETAVYRITGVLSVIGGWFATAFAAFACSFVVSIVFYYGKFPAMFTLFAIVVIRLVRSNMASPKEDEESSDKRFNKILSVGPETKVYPLIQEYNRGEWAEILRWNAECYDRIVHGFLRENIAELRTVGKQVKILMRHVDRLRRQSPLCSEKLAQEDMVTKNFFLYQANDFIVDILSSLKRIEDSCKQHVDNDFPGLSKDKCKTLLRFSMDVCKRIESAAYMVENMEYGNFEAVRDDLQELGNRILNARKVEMLKPDSSSVKTQVLYLTILYESRALLDSVASFAKASKKFLTEKQPR